MGTICPGAAMCIIGEAPGPTEVDVKFPFAGWSGGVLDTALWEGGLRRDQCSITNVILCQPLEGGNFIQYIESLMQPWRRRVKRAIARGEEPPPQPMLPQTACAPRLVRDIQESDSRVILAVGKQGLEASAHHLKLPQGAAHVAPGDPYVSSIKKQHGAPVMMHDGRVLMSSYHPAMAAPGRGRREYFGVIQENLARGAKVAARGGRVDWWEPRYELDPTVNDVVGLCRQMVDMGLEVTVDLETGPSVPGAKDGADVYQNVVRCVGIGTEIEGRERVMVVPFRHMDGTAWWKNDQDMLTSAYALREVMDKCPLAMQNGQFDTSVMLRTGLMTDRNKSWTDTLLLHHDTPDNDLPHDLGFIARRYFEVPMWKADIEHKSVDNIDDANLHLYNARDVLITQRLLKPLREDVARYNTHAQYQTDYNLAPVLREMGHLGLVIDEERRGLFSETLNWQTQRELYRFREVVGKPTFNPRSVPQLQDLIFREWGYLPVIGMDGYEIKRPEISGDTWHDQMLREDDRDLEEEDEVGSTSSAALIELMKKREVREDHKHALNILLEYRAYDKLRGTYVDNLKIRAVDWAAFGMTVGMQAAVHALCWDAKFDGYLDKELLPVRAALSRLNTIYKGHVIPTGRLATQPAVQNWPALGKANMREMVVAPPGHVIVGADYAQLELRLYAVAAQDELLLEAILTGKDGHSLNAAALLAKNFDELEYWYKRIELGEGIEPSQRKKFRKYWRTIAKRFAFLEIYGGEEGKLFSVMSQQRDKVTGKLSFPDLKEDDVKLWHNNWHTLHPWTKQWHERCAEACAEFGFSGVRAIDYRKRFFLWGASKKNAIPNMTIQGFAASIANRALLQLAQAVPFYSWSPWTGVMLQVHDYIGLYAPEERAEEAKDILEDCMFYSYDGIDFPAEGGISRRWSGQD